jgi:stage V sporulation protein D (sporulation-specific penicillin-binding protein)
VDTETARAVSELLRSVVANGNGNRADIPGYHVAGKTGTAEVPEGGAYGNDIIASFVGFAPVDDPALAILVVLYKPKVESAYGGVLAAPVFKEIMEESLEYLGIKRREEVRRRSSLTSVPNVINLSRQEAQARLAQDGLFWTMEGEGTLVTDQTPRPGVQVPAQTTVHLYFDLGEPEDVEVPSVLGLSMFDASAKLSAAGLRVRVVGSGVAAQQSPGAGARVPKGSLVEVRFEL